MTLNVSWIGGLASRREVISPISAVILATSVSSAKTAAAPPNAGAVIVHAVNPVYVAVGPEPSVVASASNGMHMHAGSERVIVISPGDAVAAVNV